MAMNILESAAYIIGRSRGLLRKGWEDVFGTSGARPDLSDPTAWMDSKMWGAGLTSGRPRTKADFVRQFQGWVYIATKLNAQSVASVPLRLYVAKQQKGKKFKTIQTRPVEKARLRFLQSQTGLGRYFMKSEEVEEVTDHAFLDLMEQVNPYQNRRDLMEMTTMNLDLTGEAYWFLLPDNLGVPKDIYVIPSQYMNPVFGKTLDSAIEAYEYESGSTRALIKPEAIIYFTYPNPNNSFTGFSTIRGIAETIYIQNQMDAFEAALFENRARVGGVITQHEFVNEADRKRMQEQFSQKHAGSKQAGKIMWLPKGLDYQKDTMTPEEISFVEGRRWTMEMTCLALDIPPGALMSKDVNRANAETADYRHAKNGVLPRCCRIEEKINERLTPRYDERLFCAFDNPVPEDKAFIAQERRENVRDGILSRDEARQEIGKDERGGLADDLLVSSLLVPITEAGQPRETEEERAARFTRLVVENMRRILE